MADIVHDPVLEFVNSIFLDYSPQYKTIKELAEKDVGRELLKEIKDVLEHKEEELPKEIRKFALDPESVREENINDIVDAFVKMRDSGALETIEESSINGIMILFNQWITKYQTLASVFQEEEINQLEQQILELEPSSPFTIEAGQQEIYRTAEIKQDIYQNLPQGAHLQDTNPYFAKTEYKAMRPNL